MGGGGDTALWNPVSPQRHHPSSPSRSTRPRLGKICLSWLNMFPSRPRKMRALMHTHTHTLCQVNVPQPFIVQKRIPAPSPAAPDVTPQLEIEESALFSQAAGPRHRVAAAHLLPGKSFTLHPFQEYRVFIVSFQTKIPAFADGQAGVHFIWWSRAEV